jgi:hypothetical protein
MPFELRCENAPIAFQLDTRINKTDDGVHFSSIFQTQGDAENIHIFCPNAIPSSMVRPSKGAS